MRGASVEVVGVAVDDVGPSHLVDHLSRELAALAAADGAVVVGVELVIEV